MSKNIIGPSRVVGGLVVVAWITLVGNIAFAQDEPYDFLNIPPEYEIRAEELKLRDPSLSDERALSRAQADAEKQRRDKKTLAFNVLRGSAPLAGNEATFDDWFKQVVLAEMTQTDDASLADIPKNRQLFFRDYIEKSGLDQNVLDRLIQGVTFPLLQKIVTNDGGAANYHPAVRYNAMLIIGRLNSREAVTVGGKALPIPFEPARKFMLAEFKNPDQIDAVRVAALLGLQRHAQLEGQQPRMQPADRKEIVDLALAIVADPAPDNRSEEGHAWIQRRAMDILGELRDPGVDNEVALALKSIVDDDKAPLAMRCTAAVAYGRLNFPPAKLDPAEAMQSVADVAVTAVYDELAWIDGELKRLKELRDRPKLSAGGGGIPGMNMGGMVPDAGADPGGMMPDAGGMLPGDFFPGGGADPLGKGADPKLQKYQISRSRLRLKYPINCVQEAVRGLQRYSDSDPKQKDFADKLSGELAALYRATGAGSEDNAAEPVNEFKAAVRGGVKSLETVIASSPAAAKAVKRTPDPPADAKADDAKADDAADLLDLK